MANENTKQELLRIAKEHFIEIEERGDLVTRGSDREDFIEVSVWGLASALEEAFTLGWDARTDVNWKN